MNLQNDPVIKEILERLEKLEGKFSIANITSRMDKAKGVTLAELARKEIMKKANGQQKTAVIVGYHEKVLGNESVKPEKVKQGWRIGKFTGKFNPAFLHRAAGHLIRNLDDGTYDLSQSGEDFFNKVMSS